MKKILLLFVLSFSMTAVFAQLEGTTWKLAPQAGALGVGSGQGDISWWSNSAADLTTRACLFDDQFVFNADGSFMNIQDGSTWVEGWQGGADACAAPVAPHDGSNAATWAYDATGGTITLSGVGAHLGLPKPYNGGELTSPAGAPASITYLASLSPDGNTMTVDISIGGGFWRYILAKDVPAVDPVVEGVWKLAPQAGALGVGPGQGDMSWWSNSAADLATRACLFDDKFVFGTDGSFRNIQAGSTWVEGWQGGTDACAAPVAPHNGSNAATFAFDAMAGTITLTGVGAHLGLPKPYNGGELTSPAGAPASITYLVSFSPDANTMTVDISIGGGFWRYVMVKTSGPCSAPTNIHQTPGYPANCHVMWDAVPDAARYDIFYRINGTSTWTRTGALSNSKTLHGLDPTAVYQYRVRTNCGDGWDFANASKFHYFNMNNAPQPRENVVGLTGIAPNPVRDVLNVGFSTEIKSDVNLSIFDMMGRTVYQNIINNVEGQQNEAIDVSNLNQGYYMLVIQSGDKRIVEKFATVR